MNVLITQLISGNAYFEITNNESNFLNCQEISKVLNLDIDTYIELLINKVIQHNVYNLYDYFENNKDVTFNLNGVSKKTYIERFKDTFADQLTLLALGGTNT